MSDAHNSAKVSTASRSHPFASPTIPTNGSHCWSLHVSQPHLYQLEGQTINKICKHLRALISQSLDTICKMQVSPITRAIPFHEGVIRNCFVIALFEKDPYIYNLTLLLRAYYKNPPFCITHHYLPNAPSCAPIGSSVRGGPKTCLAVRGIKDYVSQNVGCNYEGVQNLEHKSGYLMEIAEIWHQHRVDENWFSVWEHVARCRIRDAFENLKAQEDRNQEKRDWRKGGLRKMLLRREYKKEQRRLRCPERSNEAPKPLGVDEHYIPPVAIRTFPKPDFDFHPPSPLRTVASVGLDEWYKLGKDAKQLARFEKVLRMI